MNFLKRLGSGLLAAFSFAAPALSILVPGGGAAIPLAAGFISHFAGLVGLAEHIGETVKGAGGTKLDKAAMILPDAITLLKQSEMMVGLHVIDEDLFQAACQDYINGTVKFLKAVDKK